MSHITLIGVGRYEFLMQLRRRALWIAMGIPTILVMLIINNERLAFPDILTPLERAASYLLIGACQLIPIVFGILLADRTPRERRLRTNELFDSLPISLGTRLWGKYFGATLATLIPLFLSYLVAIGFLALKDAKLIAIPALIPVFLIVSLPGLLFVGAFSIICTEHLPTPLYSILFFGYWFWGNLLQPGLPPSLSCTPLTPIGRYASLHFFAQDPNPACQIAGQEVGLGGALGSIALLLASGALALATCQRYLRWRADHR